MARKVTPKGTKKTLLPLHAALVKMGCVLCPVCNNYTLPEHVCNRDVLMEDWTDLRDYNLGKMTGPGWGDRMASRIAREDDTPSSD